MAPRAAEFVKHPDALMFDMALAADRTRAEMGRGADAINQMTSGPANPVDNGLNSTSAPDRVIAITAPSARHRAWPAAVVRLRDRQGH
jgi:hypothetical protein